MHAVVLSRGWVRPPRLRTGLRLALGAAPPQLIPFGEVPADSKLDAAAVVCGPDGQWDDGYWEQELIDRTIAELPAGRFSIRGGVPDVQALRDRYVPAAQHA